MTVYDTPPVQLPGQSGSYSSGNHCVGPVLVGERSLTAIEAQLPLNPPVAGRTRGSEVSMNYVRSAALFQRVEFVDCRLQ